MLAAAWVESGHERILALTHLENRASITLLERLGFRRREERRIGSAAWASVVFALERGAARAGGGSPV